MRTRTLFVLSLSLTMLLAACSQQAVPTLIPAATVPAPGGTGAEPPPPTTAAAGEVATPADSDAPADSTAPADGDTPAEPTLPPTIEAAFTFNGVSFTPDPAVGSSVTPESVPGTRLEDGPMLANQPDHTVFSFGDYPVQNNIQSPRIAVYPADEFASLNVAANAQIRDLKALLAAKPAELPAQLPFLPPPNAAQVLHAQAAFVPFQNGEGIRYVTHYAQAPMILTNADIFYTFQGLTSDGSQYVSAVFPLQTSVLPDTVDYSTLDFDAFVAELDQYLAATTATLNGLAPGDFTASLDSLDATIQTLYVAPATAEIPTDAAGNPLLTITFPVENGQTLVREPLDVRGAVAPNGPTSVNVTLKAGANTLATAVAPVDTATGHWTTTLDVPGNVIGQGRVEAATDTEFTAVALDLLENFVVEPDPNSTVIRLFRPIVGETAVAGYPVYFGGTIENPIDNMMTVGVLVDNCTTFVTRQEYSVEGGEWTGVAYLPQETRDERACAVAYTGTYGSGSWVEVQTPLPVLAPDDERASRIALEATFGLTFQAGGTARIAGTAVDAPEVQVVIKHPETGSVLAEGVAPVGDFGFWEISLPLPADAPEFVLVDVTLVEEGATAPYTYSTGAAVTR